MIDFLTPLTQADKLWKTKRNKLQSLQDLEHLDKTTKHKSDCYLAKRIKDSYLTKSIFRKELSPHTKKHVNTYLKINKYTTLENVALCIDFLKEKGDSILSFKPTKFKYYKSVVLYIFSSIGMLAGVFFFQYMYSSSILDFTYHHAEIGGNFTYFAHATVSVSLFWVSTISLRHYVKPIWAHNLFYDVDIKKKEIIKQSL